MRNKRRGQTIRKLFIQYLVEHTNDHLAIIPEVNDSMQ